MSETNETRSESPQQSVDQLATEANGRGILPDQSAHDILAKLRSKVSHELNVAQSHGDAAYNRNLRELRDYLSGKVWAFSITIAMLDDLEADAKQTLQAK